jgi:serine/threonine protein kinase
MKRKSDDVEVAVKFFTPGGPRSNRHVIKRFFWELYALGRFDHPCIMQLVGFQLTDEGKEGAIATLFMENGSLADILQRVKAGDLPGFWTPTGIAKLVTGLVLGMKFIHSQNAIHRNLKPSNLFVTDDGCLQIGGLTFCRFLEKSVELTGQPGTPQYHAPEIYEGVSYDEKVDVFAFGLILYEILALKPVFQPTLPVQIIMKRLVTQNFPVIPNHWLPSVKVLLNRCWQSVPMNRPSFNEIRSYLVEKEFLIIQGVDAEDVDSFIDAVEANQ